MSHNLFDEATKGAIRQLMTTAAFQKFRSTLGNMLVEYDTKLRYVEGTEQVIGKHQGRAAFLSELIQSIDSSVTLK